MRQVNEARIQKQKQQEAQLKLEQELFEKGELDKISLISINLPNFSQQSDIDINEVQKKDVSVTVENLDSESKFFFILKNFCRDCYKIVQEKQVKLYKTELKHNSKAILKSNKRKSFYISSEIT